MIPLFILAKRILLVILIFNLSCGSNKNMNKKTIEYFSKAGVPIQFKTEKVDGHVIHYASTGSEKLPSLVFIHGSPGSWDAYKEFMKDSLLLKKYRMISFDRPGFGESDPGKAMPLYQQVNLISKVYTKLSNATSAKWVGHSLGGPFVVMMAMSHPELVSGIVILAGSVSPEEEAPEKWRPFFTHPIFKTILPKTLSASNEELMYFKKEVLALGKPWENVVSPALVIHGTKDALVPFGNAAYAMERLVNAKTKHLIAIPGANHFIPWTNYTTVRTGILEFFGSDTQN